MTARESFPGDDHQTIVNEKRNGRISSTEDDLFKQLLQFHCSASQSASSTTKVVADNKTHETDLIFRQLKAIADAAKESMS